MKKIIKLLAIFLYILPSIVHSQENFKSEYRKPLPIKIYPEPQAAKSATYDTTKHIKIYNKTTQPISVTLTYPTTQKASYTANNPIIVNAQSVTEQPLEPYIWRDPNNDNILNQETASQITIATNNKQPVSIALSTQENSFIVTIENGKIVVKKI